MELPNELVDEILTRVPVKYVLRCRCVSKEWCSIIDGTKFLEKYLKVSVERNRGGVLIQGSVLYDLDGKYLVADIESLEDGSAINDISEEVGGVFNGARVIGSDNGLVCLSRLGDDMVSMFLLNPCTRKCKKLPVPGTELLEKNNLSRYFLGGFGYDNVSDDYKVVLMACCNLPTIGIMAIVYSLKKNSWTPIPGVFNAENIGFINIWGTFASDVLRWRAINLTSMDSVIVGFDIALQQFTDPQYYNGNVQLVDIGIEKTVAEEMWANPVFRSFGSSRLLMYSKSLEKILLEVEHKRLMWYDLRSKVFNTVIIPGIPNCFISHRYIESLFPLIEDKQPSHEATEKKQQPKQRFLSILLVLGSVVGSLMLLSRSRRGTG